MRKRIHEPLCDRIAHSVLEDALALGMPEATLRERVEAQT
jgi:hypothetical protein